MLRLVEINETIQERNGGRFYIDAFIKIQKNNIIIIFILIF